MLVSRLLLKTTAAALLTFAACGEHDHDHEGEDPGAEACEHLADAATTITATAGPAGAPLLGSHTNHAVTLLDGPTGGKRGVVSVMSSKPATLHVFLGAAVGLAAADASGKEITAAMPMKSGSCPALKAWYEYPVGVGRYDLTLGGAANTTGNVNVVIEID
jgi:hypothetical protein